MVLLWCIYGGVCASMVLPLCLHAASAVLPSWYAHYQRQLFRSRLHQPTVIQSGAEAQQEHQGLQLWTRHDALQLCAGLTAQGGLAVDVDGTGPSPWCE